MITALILAAAVILDLAAGDPPNRFHPVAWLGHWIGMLWKKRPAEAPVDEGRNRNSRLFLWGIIITLSGMVLFALPLYFIGFLPELALIIISIPLLKFSFSLRNLFKASMEIRDSLNEGEIVKARKLTSWHLVSRNTEELTESQITAAVIESTAENITDSFTSPLFYFVLLGLPGAWGYRHINTCDAMTGYRKDDYEWGGKFAARLDDVVNYIPARLTALFIILAGAGRQNIIKSFREIKANRHKTESPNAGWTMAAMAVLLDIKLEKEGHYVINDEGRTPSSKDIDACIKICGTAAAGVSMLLILAGLVIHGI